MIGSGTKRSCEGVVSTSKRQRISDESEKEEAVEEEETEGEQFVQSDYEEDEDEESPHSEYENDSLNDDDNEDEEVRQRLEERYVKLLRNPFNFNHLNDEEAKNTILESLIRNNVLGKALGISVPEKEAKRLKIKDIEKFKMMVVNPYLELIREYKNELICLDAEFCNDISEMGLDELAITYKKTPLVKSLELYNKRLCKFIMEIMKDVKIIEQNEKKQNVAILVVQFFVNCMLKGCLRWAITTFTGAKTIEYIRQQN